MRVLATSDIHGNVDAVRKLRKQERNNFDAVVVAGDIGSDEADEIFEIFASFDCPVLYVYGNWDYKLTYDRTFDPRCNHLHLEPFKLGPFTFVGFSGLPTHWGMNPIATRLKQEVDDKHRQVIGTLAELEAAEKIAVEKIKAEHDEHVAEIDVRIEDRRRRQYQNEISRLVTQRDRLIYKAAKPVRDIRERKAYKAYLAEHERIFPMILRLNRKALADVVARADPSRTIIVTHERLTHVSDDLAGVPLFLFGHRHGFEDRPYRGSRFVNVSALENGLTVRPVDDPKAKERNINVGNYAVIDLDLDQITVTEVKLPVDLTKWAPSGFRLFGRAWVEP